MIQTYLTQIGVLLRRLLVSYLIYFLCRLSFFLDNLNHFEGTGFFGFLADCFWGLRFDTFSIMVSNSLFILLSLLPWNLFWKGWYQRLLKWLFGIGNAVFVAANCIDIAYFPFIRKRSNTDLFDQMAGQTDMGYLLPRFLMDFWWVVLEYVIFILLMMFLYNRVKVKQVGHYVRAKAAQWALVWTCFVLGTGLAVLGVRGGFQRVPIDIVNAGSVTRPEETPIVLNTPFTLIKSVNEKALPDHHFYSDTQLKTIYDPVHYYKDGTFQKLNVVVLILESFSKEYTKLSGMKSITPFLDSLMGHSLVFTNAFSNGTKSIEGIPAILSSLPSFIDKPFVNSTYANNIQTSFASILGKEGYETAFFHGGINGTMNFDNWAPSAGYQHYFGKDEYNNNADFDGYWGIWDEPFLQYSIRCMSEFKQPFHSAIFTLSSHHPYFIPEKYKGRFPKTDLENAESIGYADYALKLFFNAAKKTAWNNNTLFVITADHASISGHPFYSNTVGNLTIPILLFKPDNSLKGVHEATFSQIDILPSTMKLLGYNKPFFSFGDDQQSGHPHNCYFYYSGTHHLYTDSMVYHFANNQLTHVFNYLRDSVLSSNIIGLHPLPDSMATRQFKAFVQSYNHTLLNNEGYVK